MDINSMEQAMIVDATECALRKVTEPRFFKSERGYQGRFYCFLQAELETRGLIQDQEILELEYQKSSVHDIGGQRPDIIFHIPAEDSGSDMTENNFAVWALKRQASSSQAIDDFEKLNQMFEQLHYPLGFFISIGSRDHFANSYSRRFPQRLKAVAVQLGEHGVVLSWDPCR